MRHHECGSEQGPELGPPASDSNVSVTGDGDGTPLTGGSESKALIPLKHLEHYPAPGCPFLAQSPSAETGRRRPACHAGQWGWSRTNEWGAKHSPPSMRTARRGDRWRSTWRSQHGRATLLRSKTGANGWAPLSPPPRPGPEEESRCPSGWERPRH